MFGRMSNSNQAWICVLGFSANRVWVVSLFFNTFYLFLYITHVTTMRKRFQYQQLTPLDYVIRWPSGLRRWSVDLEAPAIQVRSPDQDFFNTI